MTPRTTGRATAVMAATLILGLALAACTSAPTRSSSPAPSSRATAASRCSAPKPVGQWVAYETLPDQTSFSAAVTAAAGRIVRVGDRTVAFTDFVPGGSALAGGSLGPEASGLVGEGEERTVFEVAPNTSTHAADIPTTFPATNQLNVLRITGKTDVLRDFTVQGTDQGHVYNGLSVNRLKNLRATDIRVVGIPGDDRQPPGETFGINDYGTVGSQWSHIEVDGAGVGASGFGVNGSRDITVCDTNSHDNAFAMGFAFWQTNGIVLRDCSAVDNGFSGFNFERVSGSTTLIRPVAHGNRYDMRIASDVGTGRYTIVDPQLNDGHWTVTLPRRFYGKPNLQRRSDITLIVDGKSRPDLLRFQTY